MQEILSTDLILNADGSVYHLGLLPEDIADTVIAVGDPDRVATVSQFFETIHTRKGSREFITHVGTYRGKKISVISTGIGTDNVEIFFSEIDALVNIDLAQRLPKAQHKRLRVIRIGTSGALQPDIPVGTQLISEYGIGLDNLMSFYDLEMTSEEVEVAIALRVKAGFGFTPSVARASQALIDQVGKGMVMGNTVTCPGFYAPQGRALRRPIKYPNLIEELQGFEYKGLRLSNFEMETAGYYSMAKLLGHDALSVNAILANRITNEFHPEPKLAVEALIEKVLDRL